MKLKKLYIPDYYVLKDFELDFSKRISLIIGENGSGKSSIIEVLAYIFGHLHKYFVLKDKKAAFIEGYIIEYEIEYNGLDYCINIQSQYGDNDNPFDPIIQINNEYYTIGQIDRKYGGFVNLLPSKVMLFYSGITEHLSVLNNHFEKKYINSIIRLNNPYTLEPLTLPKDNPFCYIKKDYLPIILLSLLLSEEGTERLLKNRIHIDFDTLEFKITLGKPSWSKQNEYPWDAKGLVAQTFIENMFSNCDYVLDVNEDRTLYKLSFWGIQTFKQFISKYHASAEFVFKIFDVLLCSDFIKQIDINWKNGGEDIEIDRLSEGEKQLLLTWGMNFIWDDKNILYLYDEPDAALHPKWQREFIADVTTAVGDTACAVITTHSPIMLGNAKEADVKILHSGRLQDKTPNYYGKDNIAILYELMGVSDRVPDIKDQLQSLFQEIEEEHADAAKEKYAELVKILGADDVDLVKAKMLIGYMEDSDYNS